jgi:cysteinyl-tRNA synthetase
MAWKHLGEQFDIHGGGIDLVFPHHENELAQSCCAFHEERMANIWMHNGFLQVEGEKMSKSLGNFVTIRELLTVWRGRSWPGDALRFAMMQTHYRSPIDWSLVLCDNAFNTLKDFFSVAAAKTSGNPPASIVEALADDLNTPKVIAELHALRRQVRSTGDEASVALGDALAFLGLDAERFSAWVAKADASVLSGAGKVDDLIAARAAARARKDFKESDRLRDELAARGIVLKDGKDVDGNPVTTWEIAR